MWISAQLREVWRLRKDEGVWSDPISRYDCAGLYLMEDNIPAAKDTCSCSCGSDFGARHFGSRKVGNCQSPMSSRGCPCWCPRLSKAKLTRLAQRRALHVPVLILNKLYWGRLASLTELDVTECLAEETLQPTLCCVWW